jgi:hopanoid biosynthesis associated protein HpnK
VERVGKVPSPVPSDATLVVTADDFGASRGVNAAVVRAHRDGILTGASLMVRGEAAADAVRAAREAPGLGVGLHLVLAQGLPAAPAGEVRSLVTRAGRFPENPVLAGFRHAWAWCRRRGRAELAREVEAQLAAFAATGLPLGHVDGHLNMHLHPMVLPTLIALAPRYGIRAMRLTRDDLGFALAHDRRHGLRKRTESVIFRALSAYATPRLRAAGILAPARVFGLHATGHVDEAYLLALVPRVRDGVNELYCHPAVGDPVVGQAGYDHAGELGALTSPRVRAALSAAGVRLASYRALTTGGPAAGGAGG